MAEDVVAHPIPSRTGRTEKRERMRIRRPRTRVWFNKNSVLLLALAAHVAHPFEPLHGRIMGRTRLVGEPAGRDAVASGGDISSSRPKDYEGKGIMMVALSDQQQSARLYRAGPSLATMRGRYRGVYLPSRLFP